MAQKIYIEVDNTHLQLNTSSWGDLAGYTHQLSSSNWVFSAYFTLEVRNTGLSLLLQRNATIGTS